MSSYANGTGIALQVAIWGQQQPVSLTNNQLQGPLYGTLAPIQHRTPLCRMCRRGVVQRPGGVPLLQPREARHRLLPLRHRVAA